MAAQVEAGRLVGGRYRLVGRLGADAAGELWRAHDEHLRVDVAVKHGRPAVPSADADSAEVAARTAQQARGAARLRDHPHVVAVYDVVLDEDAPWTVMQLVEGRSLREHLDANGPLSVDWAADVARAVLKVLGAAYAMDVVHRNITPAAVILAGSGEVLLTNFGAPPKGGAPESLGEPGFVAPERIREAEAGGAGDLFSLGVTLYQALEGELPFSPDVPTSVLYDEAAPPLRAGRLAPLLAQLLQRDPALRPTPAQALALVDPPRDTGPAVQLAKAPALVRDRSRTDWREEDAALEGHASEVRAVAFSPDSSTVASAGDDRTVRLWNLDGGRTASTPLAGHTDWVRALAFGPDGTVLASGGDDKRILLWDLATGRPIAAQLAGHTGWVRALAFSPDGTLLASAGGDKVIRLWDVASGGSTAVFTGHTGWVRSVAFSPDGTVLATGGNDKVVRLWHVSSGENFANWQGVDGRVHAVRFSPDGRLLAAAGNSGVRLWEVATGTPVPAWNGIGGRIRSLSFGPDNMTIATGSTKRTVTLWDLATASPRVTWTGTYGQAYSVVHSPDGTMLASGDVKRVRLWYPPR